MAKLTAEVKAAIAKQRVFPFATASNDGIPNVIPITFLRVLDDDTLLVVDNLMEKSKKNIESNPVMAVCVWDLEGKSSYQIKGEITVHTSGPVFESACVWVKDKIPSLKPRAAFAVKVLHVYVCQPGQDLGKEL